METLGLGDYIRRRRDAMGWTQTDLADRAGMNRAVLAQIETGRIKLPSAEFRRAIAAALNVRHVDLLVAAGELHPEELGSAQPVPSSVAPFISKVERLRVADRVALERVLDTMLESDAASAPETAATRQDR